MPGLYGSIHLVELTKCGGLSRVGMWRPESVHEGMCL